MRLRSRPGSRRRTGSSGHRAGGRYRSRPGSRYRACGSGCGRMVRRRRALRSSRVIRHSRSRIIRRPANVGWARRSRGRRGGVYMRRGRHRACRSHGRRRAMISSRQLTSVGACGVLMGDLVGRRWCMRFPPGCGLLRCRRRSSPARAVEACSGRVVINYCRVIGIVNNRGVHLGNRGVIRIVTALPCATEETNSAIAEAIINPAVESNMRSPVTSVEAVKTAGKAPIGRCPQDANSRR